MIPINADAKNAFETLRARVYPVAKLHRTCAVAEGAGKLVWWISLPLLVMILLQYFVGLPYYLRAPILPLLAIVFGLLLWRIVLRPWMAHYSLTRAAMLIESKRPSLNSKVVSALEIFEDLEREKPRFDRSMVEAAVIDAQRSTAADDFGQVIDRRPARNQVLGAIACVIIWVAAFLCDPSGLSSSLFSMGSAWREIGEVLAVASGARIVIQPMDRPAYLVGTDAMIRGAQNGFHSDEMSLLTKVDGETKWKSEKVSVDASGRTEYHAKEMSKSFECYFESGRFVSDHVKVVVTERPRVVNLKVETDLPAYARRAPIIEPRCDGNLKDKLFGSSIALTITANKKLKTALMKRSYVEKSDELVVGAQYAKASIRLNEERWLADESRQTIVESYRLILTDEYGFTNEDADHPYELIVEKDRPPTVALIVPHKSVNDEPHVLEQALGGLNMVVRAADDYGIAKVTVHYRVESLETNAEKSNDTRTRTFQLPQQEIKQLSLMRFLETGARVGDRILFWAEVEDGYDLEPKKGPHKAKTPTYRIAVVTEEESFKDFVTRDTWTPNWYEGLKKVTLAARDTPARTAAESEPAAKVATKLSNAPKMDDGVRADDQQLIQDYFNNLNVVK